jgi:hypothetical protein
MSKSTIILIALFLLLAVAAFFLWPSPGERETSYGGSAPEFSIDSSSVIRIGIQSPGKSVTLENVGGTWLVTSPVRYPANVASVSQLLGSLAAFKTGSLVSSNPDKQSLFQVDSAAATRLTVTERTGNATSLLIGKMGPSFSEVYFRVPSSQDVYLGTGLSPWTLSQEVKEWRDRTIVAIAQDSIREIQIAFGGKLRVLTRTGTTWFSGADSLPPTSISPLLSTLGNFRADDFLDQPPAIETTPVSVKVSGREEVVIDLYPLPPDSAKYAARSSKSGQMFTIPKYTAKQFLDLTGKLAK